MGLGPLLVVSLADAREAAQQARKLVFEGKNPIEERRAHAEVPTFGAMAEALIADLKEGWKAETSAAQWTASLSTHAAEIWETRVNAVETPDIVRALKPIWTKTPETADRVRGRIERVLDAAIAKGYRTGENPARWKGNLKHLLPARKKLTRGHHKALTYKDAPALMLALAARHGFAARALEFTILTAARENETLGAYGREVDRERMVWTVPPERMKGGMAHEVPLTESALLALGDPVGPDELLFPGAKAGRPMSNMAMDMLLRRLEIDVTVHGFRSTFRDWAGDMTEFPREVAEAALAHKVGDETERAYRRGTALERRRQLMQAWADFLAGGEGVDQVL